MVAPKYAKIPEATLSKIGELVSSLSIDIIDTAISLYNSGAIDVGDFIPEGYALPKILVTASILQNADNFAPIDKKQLQMVKNLVKF